MTPALSRIARAVVLSGAVLLTVVGPGQAARTATPVCWKLLITDWYDGTIDRSYAIPCYQQAVDHLPTDAQLYSSAREDILRAMRTEIAAQAQATTPTTTEAPPTTTQAAEPPATPTTTAPPPPPPPPTTTEATTTEAEVVPPPATTTTPGRDQPEGVAGALDKLNPGDADSFPLPLLILGGLAIVLVAAGVAGMIWRRVDRGGGDAGPA